MADIPVLLCTAGALAGRTIGVPEGGLDIGRSEENHVIVQDEGVSRFHARLLYDNGSLWLQDAGSRNGVFVNGVRITGHKALKVGDEITIALHQFTVHWAAELEPTDTATSEPAPNQTANGSRSTLDSSARERSDQATPTPNQETPHQATSRPNQMAPNRDDDSTDETPKRRWFWPFS